MLHTNIFILATDVHWNLQVLNTCSGRCKVILPSCSWWLTVHIWRWRYH